MIAKNRSNRKQASQDWANSFRESIQSSSAAAVVVQLSENPPKKIQHNVYTVYQMYTVL